jgi:predicted dehydrogenase
MFRNFADLVLNGKVDPKWGDIAMKTQQVMDACAESARNGSQPVQL